MNEVEFARLSRGFESGTPVLFFPGDSGIGAAAAEAPAVPAPHAAATAMTAPLDAAIREAVAAGVVLRFVDPAKPLLVYRLRGEAATGVDFFQDALYAAEPAIEAESFILYAPYRGAPGDLEPWISRLEELVGLPLSGETPLFEAYSRGAFGRSYPEKACADPSKPAAALTAAPSVGSRRCAQSGEGADELARWLSGEISSMGREPGAYDEGDYYSVWEGHDVYSFT